MKLYLKNIGKITEAAVEISGITVIAGENNTGKSTVGRALFAVFNSFYHIQEQIASERIRSVENWLDHSLYLNGDLSTRNTLRMIDTNKMAGRIVSHIDSYKAREQSGRIREGILSLL